MQRISNVIDHSATAWPALNRWTYNAEPARLSVQRSGVPALGGHEIVRKLHPSLQRTQRACIPVPIVAIAGRLIRDGGAVESALVRVRMERSWNIPAQGAKPSHEMRRIHGPRRASNRNRVLIIDATLCSLFWSILV